MRRKPTTAGANRGMVARSSPLTRTTRNKRINTRAQDSWIIEEITQNMMARILAGKETEENNIEIDRGMKKIIQDIKASEAGHEIQNNMKIIDIDIKIE